MNKEEMLKKIPCCPDFVNWSADTEDKVVLKIENRGFFNRLAQLVLKKPKISHIHLDALGSFVWLCIDGNKSIACIAKALEAEFGQKAYPIYERLIGFFAMLESYGLVICKS